MNARSAARILGGEAYGNRVRCPGPGHRRHDRSLLITFSPSAPDGFLVHSFANDDWQLCRDYVRDVLGVGAFKGQARRGRPAVPPARPIAPDPKAVRDREFAFRTWSEALPIGGTLAETYLLKRGIVIPPEIFCGDAIRFHPQCPFRLLDTRELVRLPAMVAAVVDIRTSDFLALHRTALRSDGGKLRMPGLPDDSRMMLGSNKGGVVKLTPDEEVAQGLVIAEGLETCLTGMGNYGFRPMWAALSSGALGEFPVLPGVDALTIFADNDQSGTGARAALKCAERWTSAGGECVIGTPPEIGTDLNDLARMAAA
jgi:putative DNA primase/helicase